MIEDYFNAVLSWSARSGNTDTGQPTFAAAASKDARFTGTSRLVTTAEGKVVMAEAEVWLSPSESPAVGDQFVFEGETFSAVSVRPARMFGTDVHHKKIFATRVAV